MSKYSPERKEAVVKKFFPPLSRSVTELVVEEGISAQTLYNWRNELNVDGYAMPLKWKTSLNSGHPKRNLLWW
jgi:transposase-like protein